MSVRDRSMVRIMSVACATFVGMAVVGQSEPAGDAAAPVSSSGVADLGGRLEALRPDDPMAYFELAEEVAYEMPSAAGRELARRLFVLSFELDRGSEHPMGLGGSVCLALADLSVDVNEQRWLRALAEVLEGALRDVRWSASATVGGSDRAPLDLANAMGRLRAGDVRSLRTLLSRLDVRTMLRDAGMKGVEADALVDELEDQIGRSRARPASREIRKTIDGELVVELDDASGGNPGPSLAEDEYLQQVRAEMLLLDARPATWASQLLLDGGVPLRDIDPGELAPYFGVDPRLSVYRVRAGSGWRAGAWVVPGEEGERVLEGSGRGGG